MSNKTSSPSGLALLQHELDRQFSDALETYQTRLHKATFAAQMIQQRQRLLLLGMGGSHWVNRVVEPLYRAAGIDATAHILSEYMRAPLQLNDPCVILTSQSGASGEVIHYLDDADRHKAIIGLTLDPTSILAMETASLIGCGGVEKAYAATRSLLVTLALHAGILEGLGSDRVDFTAALKQPDLLQDLPETKTAVATMGEAKSAIFVSRGILQGVADAAALSLMELARIPVQSLEGGQFRHGPFESVGPQTCVVFIRGAGKQGAIDHLALECVEAGAKPIIIDLSGQQPIGGCTTLALTRSHGLEGAARALTVLQGVIISAAQTMVENVGAPLRSSKVTNGEAVLEDG